MDTVSRIFIEIFYSTPVQVENQKTEVMPKVQLFEGPCIPQSGRWMSNKPCIGCKAPSNGTIICALKMDAREVTRRVMIASRSVVEADWVAWKMDFPFVIPEGINYADIMGRDYDGSNRY